MCYIVQFLWFAAGLHLIWLATPWEATTQAAAVVVAPVDATPRAKARADLVCDGQDDEVELLQSLQFARRYVVRHATAPSGHREVTLPGRHTVEWLPGTYQLGHTLLLPDAADCAIKAQGTWFRYAAKTGDAIRIPGMLRCRYHLGTIESHSAGAAIRVTGTVDDDLGDPAHQTPCQMSVLSFTGLIGQHYRGTGLLLDNARPGGITVNRFTGTDIAGFHTGVRVTDASAGSKCDTNYFSFHFIRECRTCIYESGHRVDSNVWSVNVDATVAQGIAIRTAARYGKWEVIMGTYQFEDQNRALLLDPGAAHNIITMHPPLEQFAHRDRSGNETNVLLSAHRLKRLLQSTAPAAR